jgi:ribosomal protein S27E
VTDGFGLFPAVEFVLEMTAMPSRSGHLGIFSCRSWKRTFTVKLQYPPPKKIRLIVQSFSDLLFDILECHYSRMKDVLAIQQEQKYKRHRPETTLLYQLVERYYPEFTTNLAEQGKYLPKYVEREFDEFLRCGRLEYGFLRVVCGDCKHEKLVAFSCKRHGFCPSCGARRMAESAALLVDDVLRQ